MNLSLIFVGKRNYKKILEDIENNLVLDSSDFNVYFLTNEDFNHAELDTKIDYKILRFDQYSTENEMLEYVFQNIKLGNVLLFKESYQNFNVEEANKMLISLTKKEHDLIITKQQKDENFFTKALFKIKKFVIKLFTGNNIYDGEADIMFLSTLSTSIIKQTPKKSAIYIKMNAWTGITPHIVKISSQDKIKKKTNFAKSTIVSLSALCSLLLLMIVGNILFSVLKIKLPFIAMLSYILVEVALLGFICFVLLKMLVHKEYGKINFINEGILVQTITNF